MLKEYYDNYIITPSSIKDLIGQKNKRFRNYGQEDSHEFMMELLEILETDILSEKKTNFVSKIFL